VDPTCEWVDREKASRMKGVNPRRNLTSAFTPMVRASERLGPACGLRPTGEERPAGAGWAEGRVGGKVGRAESEEKRISKLKIGFLN
jgi:hypothetical protein